jgi:hypothetical protein
MKPQRAATDRLTVQGSQQHRPHRPCEVRVRRRIARGRVESGLEAPPQLRGVRTKTRPRARRARICLGDPYLRRREEALDLGHCTDQPHALLGVERPQDGGGDPVGAPVEHGTLPPPGRREPRGSHPAVAVAGPDLDETAALQRSQQPADVSGVEVEPRPQLAHIAAAGPDLPEQPSLPEGAVARQEGILQRAYALGDDPIEPAQLRDHVRVDRHSLTLVRELAGEYRRSAARRSRVVAGPHRSGSRRRGSRARADRSTLATAH